MESIENELKQKKIRKPVLILWISFFLIIVFLFTYLIIVAGFRGINYAVFMGMIFLLIASLISIRLYDMQIESQIMTDRQKKIHSLKLNLWIALAVILGLTFLTSVFIYSPIPYTLIFIELICLAVFSFIVLKSIDLNLVAFLMLFIGLYVKRLHWNLASEDMTLGTVILSAVSLYNSVKFLTTFRKNLFLKWFGFFAGIIIALFMTGMLFMNQHWNGNVREILIFSGVFLFFIYVFALVFTLPNSNYISWNEIERKACFRAVLIPMVFIFALITLIVVFPVTYNTIMGRAGYTKPQFSYENNKVELIDKDGIQKK